MPDSAQIEQELKQRQGVAKEDTLPPIENKDLQYVPTTQQVLYAPPSMTSQQKYLLPLLRNIKHFIPEIMVFMLYLVVFAYVLNYFNFLPLSTMYPKIFGLLPHKYDVEGNNRALSDIAYSSEIEGYQLEGKFYSATADKILIEYKGKVVEFEIGQNIECSKKVGNEYLVVFCEEILHSKNNGHTTNINFIKDTSKINIITFISID